MLAGSVGRIAFDNLRAAGYAGELIAVNPKYSGVAGIPCYPSIAVIGHRVDLILATPPAATVPAIIDDAGNAGMCSAVVLSAGFGEFCAAGRRLKQKMLAAARSKHLIVLKASRHVSAANATMRHAGLLVDAVVRALL